MKRGLCLPAALLTAACGGPGVRFEAREDVQLARAITLEEVTHDGGTIPIETSMHLARVDFRSVLKVHLDGDRIREAAASIAGPSRRALGDEAAAQAARALLIEAESYLTLAEETEGLAVRLRRGEGSWEELTGLMGRRGELGEKLMDAARAVSLSEASRRGYDTSRDQESMEWNDRRTERLVDAVDARLYPPGRLLDFEALGLLLNREFELLSRGLEEEVESLQAVRLRVRGFLIDPDGSEPIPISIADWDTIPSGGGVEKRAVSLRATPEELTRLNERMETVGRFASFTNRLRSGESSEHVHRAVAEVERQLARLPVELPPPGWRGTLIEEARLLLEARQAPGLDSRALKGAVDAGRELDELVRRARAVDWKDAAAVLRELPVLVRSAEAVPDQLTRIAQGVRVVRERLGAEGPEAAQAAAKDLLARLARGGEAELRSELGPLLTFLAELGRLLGISDRRALGQVLRAPDVDPRVVSRPLDRVVDAEVDVAALPADRGDRIYVLVELVEIDAQGQELAVKTHTLRFAVERLGFFNTLDAHAIFAKRLKEPGGGIPDTDWEASPAASWTLHYRMREEGEGAHRWAPVWNFLDLGLGIHASALNFENDGVEVGAGVQASLFGDLVQAGLGWNLNVNDDREYVFLGIGVIEALDVAAIGVGRGLSAIRGGSSHVAGD